MTNITVFVDTETGHTHATLVAKMSTASIACLSSIQTQLESITPKPLEASCVRDGNSNVTVCEIIIDSHLHVIAAFCAVIQFKSILSEIVCVDGIIVDKDQCATLA